MLWAALAIMALCAGAFVALPFLAPERPPADDQLAAQPANKRAAIAAASAVLLAGAALYAFIGAPNVPSAPAPKPTPAVQELTRLVGALQQKLNDEPDDARGWQALGWVFFMEARYADSASAYQRAIALQPGVAAFRSAYGEALVGAGQGMVSPDAAQAFRDALARDKADVRARFYLGLLKAQNGDAAGAIDDWFALYKQAPPGSAEADDLRDRIEALAAENKIDVSARLPPRGPSASDVENAANMSGQQRAAMIDAMVSSLDRRLRANPQDLEGWLRLVHARAVQGRMAEARDALARARRAFAGNEAALARLSESARQSGVQ